jgi:hypothetical protein
MAQWVIYSWRTRDTLSLHPKNKKEECGRKQSWLKQVLSWHLAGGRETHKNHQDRWCSGQDLNQAPPEYKLSLEPTCSITRILFFSYLGFT